MATWPKRPLLPSWELMFQSLVLTALDCLNTFFQSGTGASEFSALLKEESLKRTNPFG